MRALILKAVANPPKILWGPLLPVLSSGQSSQDSLGAFVACSYQSINTVSADVYGDRSLQPQPDNFSGQHNLGSYRHCPLRSQGASYFDDDSGLWPNLSQNQQPLS